MKRLSKKLKFVKSDDLIESLLLKEQEKEKEENEENQENNEDLDNSKQLRNLGFDGSFSLSWNLVTFNILGKDISIKYEIGLKEGSLKNTLTLICGSLKIPFGNEGTSSNKKESKGVDKTLFSVPFPGTPIPIFFTLKAGGNIGYEVDYNIPKKQFSISLSGNLVAKAEVGAGDERIAEIAVGAEGTLIQIKAFNLITKMESSYVYQNKITLAGGEITCYVKGSLVTFQVFDITKKFSEGWSKTIV